MSKLYANNRQSLYGSLQNRLLERTEDTKSIKVGDGATIIMYSDRCACTVIEVKSKCSAVIQRDKAVCTGGSYSNEWELSRDKNGMKYEIYCRNGIWKTKEGKSRVIIGERMEYYDYEF